MAQFDEVFETLTALREELQRLRRIEQAYFKLRTEHEALQKKLKVKEKGLTVKPEEGFNFFTDLGTYTGYSAVNFEEFYQAFQRIPLESIEFHSQRGDFEKWLTVIGLDDLATKIETIKLLTLTGEDLKQSLLKVMDEFLAN